MIVRALDANHDWQFGKGKNDYKKSNDAVAQSINTRLQSFLGDCFFSLNSGIDWFNLLGSKNQIALNLAVSATILNSPNITGILELSLTLNHTNRIITIVYKAQSAFGAVGSTYQFDVNTF